jgi:hypothetical protein
MLIAVASILAAIHLGFWYCTARKHPLDPHVLAAYIVTHVWIAASYVLWSLPK